MGRKIMFSLFSFIFLVASLASALDVKIELEKKVGNVTVLSAFVDDNPTTNAVTVWWCTRAARLSGSEVYQLSLSGTNTSFTCEYTRRANGHVADCSCMAKTLVRPEVCSVVRVWSQETSRGETVFVRSLCEYPISYPVAGGFANEIQTRLQIGTAYDFDSWIFLFDNDDDSRFHREYSLGQVVNNSSGSTVSQTGNWAETPTSGPPNRGGVDRTKEIYCALVRLQDTGVVDDSEAYSVIAEQYGVSEDEVLDVVDEVIKGFVRRNDYSIERYCAGR